jgi:hypothetical protein
MFTRSLARGGLLALTLALGSCASAGQSDLDLDTMAGPAEDNMLVVRSEHWDPLVIVLVGDGFQQHIGTIERLQVRTFRLPARLMGPDAFVALNATSAAANFGFTTKLFSLNPGDAVNLTLEHRLTMSSFEIRRR